VDKRRIGIIGLGGGGCRVVDRISSLSADGPVLVAVNSDARALEDTAISHKIQIGTVRTGGQGAGGDVELGKLAATDDAAQFKALLKNLDMIFLVVGLGGGTGTGAAPVILNLAREAGCLALCVASLPFTFEGETRVTVASDALPAIREAAHAVIGIPNDMLFDTIGRGPVSESFVKADEVVGAAVRSLWKLLTNPGYLNLTFADLARTVQGSGGLCSFAYGMGNGADKSQRVIAQLLESPLTRHGELLDAARSVLISIVGGPDLALQDVGDVMNTLTGRFSSGAHIAMGTVVDDSWRNKMMVTLVFSDRWDPEGAKADVGTKKPKDAPSTRPRAISKSKQKRKQAQSSLAFEAAAMNRFKDANPTLIDGEDLDIPTFIRRGMTLPDVE
jgi:cell division protein FtsZ